MRFCERQHAQKSKLDPRSFRWVRSGNARVLVACPKGKWSSHRGRCNAGLRAYKILTPARGRCPIGTKSIRKRKA